MKILYHHRIASRDGQAVHMDEMIHAFREQGHEIILVGPAMVENMDFGGEDGFIAKLKRRLPGSLYEILEAGYTFVALGRLIKACRQHKPDIIYERFALFMFAGMIVKRLFGLKLILEVNGPLMEERAEHDSLKLKGFGRWAQGLAWRDADRNLPVTDVLADYLRRYGTPEERIEVVANGINRQRFNDVPDRESAKKTFGLEGRIVLGFTGFVRAWNKMERVLDIIADNKDELNLHLLLVGDGPAREDLIAYAAKRDISDRLTITGVVARDDVARHVAAFDVALQPGVTAYASPLKMLEYMYLGRAIVAPDMANIRELLDHDETALLFEEGDDQAFKDSILAFCRDDALRQRLGDAARAAIDSKRLTWMDNAERVIEMAEKLKAR